MRTDRRGFMQFLTGGAAALGITHQQLDAENHPKVDTLIARGPGGHVEDYDRFDLVNWAIYDRIKVETGGPVQRMVFFNEPVGSYKGFEATNMMMACRLPMPQAFWVKRIYFIFDPNNGESDMKRFCSGTSWRFVVGFKVFAAGPMVEHSTRIDFTNVVRKNGYPDGLIPADAKLLEPHDILIEPGQHFEFSIQGAEGQAFEAEFSFHAFLDGVLARPIQ